MTQRGQQQGTCNRKGESIRVNHMAQAKAIVKLESVAFRAGVG